MSGVRTDANLSTTLLSVVTVEHPVSEPNSQGWGPGLSLLNCLTLGMLLSWNCSFLFYGMGITITPTS